MAAGLSQRDVALRAGVSQSAVARLELGVGHPTIDAVRRVAASLGRMVEVSVVPDGQNVEERAVRCAALVAARATPGGWIPVLRSVRDTILIRPARREVTLAIVWDVITDPGEAAAAAMVALAEESRRHPPDWRTGLIVIICNDGANRRRLTERATEMAAAFPVRGSLWLAALSYRMSAMPLAPGMLWTDTSHQRLRSMIPYLDRRVRARSTTTGRIIPA